MFRAEPHESVYINGYTSELIYRVVPINEKQILVSGIIEYKNIFLFSTCENFDVHLKNDNDSSWITINSYNEVMSYDSSSPPFLINDNIEYTIYFYNINLSIDVNRTGIPREAALVAVNELGQTCEIILKQEENVHTGGYWGNIHFKIDLRPIKSENNTFGFATITETDELPQPSCENAKLYITDDYGFVGLYETEPNVFEITYDSIWTEYFYITDVPSWNNMPDDFYCPLSCTLPDTNIFSFGHIKNICKGKDTLDNNWMYSFKFPTEEEIYPDII